MFVALSIVIVLFFGLLIFVFGKVNTEIRGIQIPDNTLGLNMTQISDNSFGNFYAGVRALNVVGYCLIFGMMLTIIISAFVVRSHPVFFVAYILLAVISVVLSIIVSMSYTSMLKDNMELRSVFEGNPINHFIISNLPIWVTIVSLLGAIIVFSGVFLPQETGMGGFG